MSREMMLAQAIIAERRRELDAVVAAGHASGWGSASIRRRRVRAGRARASLRLGRRIANREPIVRTT